MNQTRWAALMMIIGAALVRLAYIACFSPFDLAPDEAHYWDWSRRLDWCYYSKGPLVAWLIRASTLVFGDTVFAVRIPAVICGSLLLLGMHTLTRLVYACDRLALGVVVAALTLPVVSAGSTLMTIDAPFLAAWMWALVFAYRAVFCSSPWSWLGAGLCIAIGLLAKHTMVLFVPSFALFLLATPKRVLLRRPGFWVMTVTGAVGALPILSWNAANDWVTFRHAQGHAGFSIDSMRLAGPLTYIAGQFALLLGFWFLVWICAMWRFRPSCETRAEERFLWWMSLPAFLFFALFAFKNGGGEPNWPLPAYLAGLVLGARWLQCAREHELAWYRIGIRVGAVTTVAVGCVATLALHEPIAMQPILLRLAGPATPDRPMPIRGLDPTARLRGWRYLAAEVDRMRAELRVQGIEPVIATERWTQASELAFYCAGHPDVCCLGICFGDRRSQYDLWRPNPIADPMHFRGGTFVFVGASARELRGAFASVEPPRTVQYQENGHLVAEWTIIVAHGFRGFAARDPAKY